MAVYRIVFAKSVRKDLRRIPRQDVVRIMDRIAALAEDPRPAGVEKLSTLERYRIRQGAYRIVYAIEDRILTVLVVKVGHRRAVYRDT